MLAATVDEALALRIAGQADEDAKPNPQGLKFASDDEYDDEVDLPKLRRLGRSGRLQVW